MLSQKDIQNYFAERIINRAKVENAVVTLVVTKAELIDPMLKACLKEKVFEDKFGNAKLKIKCSDRDIFFKEDELKSLLENHQAIEESQGKLYFEETVSIGATRDETENAGELKEFYKRLDKVERSFEEVLKINQKLSEVADKINGGYIDEEGNAMMLSPLEKYLLCFKIVNDIDYYLEDKNEKTKAGYSISRSLIDVVKNQRGCCVGKSEYLYALLKMVGIENCCITIDSNREDLIKTMSNKEILKDDYYYDLANSPLSNSEVEDVKYQLKHIESQLVDLLDDGKSLSQIKTNHKANLINLNDEKYGFNGIFLGDSTAVQLSLEILPLKDKLDYLLNFASYFSSGSEISKFLDNIGVASIRKPEHGQEKIEEGYVDDYFSLTRNMIINKFKELIIDNYNNASFALGSSQFLQQLQNCQNYGQLQKVIDNYCSDNDNITGNQNKFAPIYRKIFEEILYDDKERYLNIVSIKDVRERLKGANLLENSALTNFGRANEKTNEIFAQIFKDTEYEAVQKLKESDKEYFKNLPLHFRDNERIVKTAITRDCHALEFASDRLKGDKEIVSLAMSKNIATLEYASDKIKDDSEFMLDAIIKNRFAFDYASDRLKKDPYFVYEAIKINDYIFDVMPKEVYEKYNPYSASRAIVIMGIKKGKINYKDLSDDYKKDFHVCLAAASKDGLLLKNFPEEYKNDKEIVLEAVRKDGNALEYASKKMQSHFEIVLNAVRQKGKSLGYAAEILRDDRDIVLTAVKQDGQALEFASEELKNDIEIVTEAIREDVKYFQYASEKMKDNLVIALKIVLRDNSGVQYLSDRLKNLRIFQNPDNVELQTLLDIYNNPEDFEKLPLDAFQSNNADFLDVLIELIELKFKELPQTEENKEYRNQILSLLEKTIKNKTEQIIANKEENKDCTDENESDINI